MYLHVCLWNPGAIREAAWLWLYWGYGYIHTWPQVGVVGWDDDAGCLVPDFVSTCNSAVYLPFQVPRTQEIVYSESRLCFRFDEIFGYSYGNNTGKSNLTGGVRAQLILVQGPGEDTSDKVGQSKQRRKVGTGQGRGRETGPQIRDTTDVIAVSKYIHIISASSSSVRLVLRTLPTTSSQKISSFVRVRVTNHHPSSPRRRGHQSVRRP